MCFVFSCDVVCFQRWRVCHRANYVAYARMPGCLLCSIHVFFFSVLRRCTMRCWVRLTQSYGPPFLLAVDFPAVNFQQTHVGRQSVLPGLPLPVDRSLPLHHQPSACLHIIGIVLSFYMSMPPQSASSHHIPNWFYIKASSQFSAGLSFFQGNTTHPPDHPHLRPFHLWLQLCLNWPCLAPVPQAASNACHVNLALHPHRWRFGW